MHWLRCMFIGLPYWRGNPWWVEARAAKALASSVNNVESISRPFERLGAFWFSDKDFAGGHFVGLYIRAIYRFCVVSASILHRLCNCGAWKPNVDKPPNPEQKSSLCQTRADKGKLRKTSASFPAWLPQNTRPWVFEAIIVGLYRWRADYIQLKKKALTIQKRS